MKVQAVKCPTCGDIIFSRARHDFRVCSCDETFVDGGFDCFRYGGDNHPIPMELEIEQTEAELYQDWNYRTDKYGVIHG